MKLFNSINQNILILLLVICQNSLFLLDDNNKKIRDHTLKTTSENSDFHRKVSKPVLYQVNDFLNGPKRSVHEQEHMIKTIGNKTSGQLDIEFKDTNMVSVNTVADLSSIHSEYGADKKIAIVLGYHQKNDGGGGIFVFDASLTASDNDNGLVFDGWKRSIVDSALNVKWFGAISSGCDQDGNYNNDNCSQLLDTNDPFIMDVIAKNNEAFKNTFKAFRNTFRGNDPLVNSKMSKSGIFIPSGEYLIGENALFPDDMRSNFNYVIRSINYFSDGNAILTLTNRGDTYAFKNEDKGLFYTFNNITFIGLYDDTNAFISLSDGNAQDYLFERCTFLGKFDTVFTVRALSFGNNNSEWSFDKCTFAGDIKVVLDVKDSDQFLNYWFNETKFWSKHAQTLISEKGGHFKFVNCDWSGFEPNTETYLFELNSNNSFKGINDFKIINGRFELKNDKAKVLKSNWNQGNIEISADFGSQVFQPFFTNNIDNLKHFEFNIQGNGTVGNSLNINFKNSIMMGIHEFNYKNNSWRGTGKVLYENCAFPKRNTLDNFIKINHSSDNKGGIAIIEVRNAIFENNYGNSLPMSEFNLQVSDIDYLPSYNTSRLRKKYAQIAHPATGENPLAGQKMILNFPTEAESIITKVSWYLPKNRLASNRTVNYVLEDVNGNVIKHDFDSTRLRTGPKILSDGFNIEQNVYINVKNLPEGKLILRDRLNQADEGANEFQCIVEYF